MLPDCTQLSIRLLGGLVMSLSQVRHLIDGLLMQPCCMSKEDPRIKMICSSARPGMLSLKSQHKTLLVKGCSTPSMLPLLCHYPVYAQEEWSARDVPASLWAHARAHWKDTAQPVLAAVVNERSHCNRCHMITGGTSQFNGPTKHPLPCQPAIDHTCQT